MNDIPAGPLSAIPPATGWPQAAPEQAGQVVVVIRTRDRPALLERACLSVLGQSLRTWQLVVVNDGGAPGDVETMLERYRPVFGPRLTVIHHPVSRGMSAAANAGLEAAQGEFAVFLDDDDTWHPHFLGEAAAFLGEAANAGLAGAACQVREVFERLENGQIVFEGETAGNAWMRAVGLNRVMADNPVPACSLLLRRAALVRVGPLDETLAVLGFWDLLLRLLAVAEIGVLPRPLAFSHRRTNLPGSPYANARDSAAFAREDAWFRNAALRRQGAVSGSLLLGLGPDLLAATRTMDALAARTAELEQFLDALRQDRSTAPLQESLVRQETHLLNLAQRYHVHAGEMESRLAALEDRLDRLIDHHRSQDSRLTRIDEIHLWLAVLTWPLRVVWRPIRRTFLALGGPGGNRAA